MNSHYKRLSALHIEPDKVLADLSLSTDPYTVFLSGSIIEGFGNAESDLDVFVVYPDELPTMRTDFDRGSNTIAVEFTTDWRLDIESWSRPQVFQVAHSLNHCPPENQNACMNLQPFEIDLAHRFRIGIPILKEDHFQELLQAFDFQHISKIIMMRSLICYNSVAEDAAGAIASKQYGTALLTARQAVQFAIDAFLAASGETNAKEKWRFQKLERLQAEEQLKQYWTFETPHITSQEDVLSYAKSCLLFAQRTTIEAQKVSKRTR